MPDFPVTAKQFNELGPHRMETEVTVSSNGRIDGSTKTWTTDTDQGFHGNVKVFITRVNENGKSEILHTTNNTQDYAVDGMHGGDSSREDAWEETIPQDALKNMTGIAIVHSTAKIVVSASHLGEWVDAIEPLITVVARSPQPAAR